MLGAGFFGFFSHTGFLQALEAKGLSPRRIIGVSAGALSGGLWASGLDGDALAEELLGLRRDEFWDPGLPLGGLLKGRKFNGKLREVLARVGVERLDQCRTPFTAIVHDVVGRRAVAMDRGRIDLAIQASCTVPLMFRPLWVEGRLLVDGGVSDRVGECAVEPDERVLMHYLPPRRRALRPNPPPPPRDRPGRRLVVITPDLPRVTPFRLDQGPVALRQTREYMASWLDAHSTGLVEGPSSPSQPQPKLSRNT